MTRQLFDTRNHPTWTSHEVHGFLLIPEGYQSTERGPCTGKFTRLGSRVDRVGRGMHAQRLEYTIVDKIHVAHAGQCGHDVRTNHIHLLSIISHCQNREEGSHYLVIVLP